MTVKCPKCGTPLDVRGLQPGSSFICQCGNTVGVPKGGLSRKMLYLLIAGGLVVLSCPCVGILAAVAIPNFMQYQGRARQAECKVHLKSFYTAQILHSESAEGYEPVLSKIGFSPERGNRYAYFAGAGPLEMRSSADPTGTEQAQAIGVDTFQLTDQAPITFEMLPPEVAQQVGLTGECPDCDITMVCAGNLDRDSTLDIWSVSLKDRTLTDGTHIAAGQRFQHVDDNME
ncbi:fimbrial protein [Stigmatella sp. ncwal1]|uniref:Fimbrial protein n=1 Tax=Stigmatella ashevillensis TaxID=2995309 RepID=A0ABT5D491_9BACT|nr:fimbrial protein [Stigmatella ashevillena]MDC0707057.1 fimbrial protein [Stigmatella ashevillena]